jgi:hypothetical protein
MAESRSSSALSVQGVHPSSRRRLRSDNRLKLLGKHFDAVCLAQELNKNERTLAIVRFVEDPLEPGKGTFHQANALL